MLTALPGQGAKTGRRRLYGGDMPTPEDIRKDEAYEWIKVGAFASGRIHSFKIKVVKNLPAINVASYSMLWLAALEMDPQQRLAPVLPPPKWRRDLQGKAHPSTSQLLHRLRHEAWAGSITASSFSHFANQEDGDAKSEKPAFDLPSALFQAA